MIGIYKITSPTKKVYIGQSINLEERFRKYRTLNSSVKSQRALYNSLLKYGVAKHKFEILELCEVNELNEKERYYQDLFSSVHTGLNCRLTMASDRSGKRSAESIEKWKVSRKGYTHSEVTREKLSKANKGKKISDGTLKNLLKMANERIGKPLSQSTRLKISAANKGRKHDETYRTNCRNRMLGTKQSLATVEKRSAKLRGGNSNGKLILNTQSGIFYGSISEAVRSTIFKRTSISEQLLGLRPNNTYFIYV